MAKIKYSQAAIQDLEQIGDYITMELKNPIAALNTVDHIQDAYVGDQKQRDSDLNFHNFISGQK